MGTHAGSTASSQNLKPPAVKGRIVVLDDEASLRRLMKVILEGEGYDVLVSDDGNKVLEQVGKESWDVVILDLRMPKMDGLTFLRLLKEKHPEMICIVLTAFGSWETSVEAMRLGAYTHLAKPFDTEELRLVVARAVERNKSERDGGKNEVPVVNLIGNSMAMNAVELMIRRIAPTDSTVLISGESGTGKELVAQSIHRQSRRSAGPFVPVNCGAFTETLLESELFGHVRGAFTNAIADRKGVFESANGGTLFLDEVGEMTLSMQVKFLRVLETRSFKPVGGVRETRSDIRIVAATNRMLAQRVVEGAFREDLYHRLNVIPILLPPLRERLEDIPLLTGFFLAQFANRFSKPVSKIEEAALNLLVKYSWPGNVRELENAIERAVALCAGEWITTDEIVGPMAIPGAGGQMSMAQLAAGGASGLMPAVGVASKSSITGSVIGAVEMGEEVKSLPFSGMNLEKHLLEQERAYIQQALKQTEWNLTEAAKLLNMTFRSIRYRISKLNIERPDR